MSLKIDRLKPIWSVLAGQGATRLIKSLSVIVGVPAAECSAQVAGKL